MKSPLKWVLFTLLAYGVFLLVQLPARLLIETWPPPAEWHLHQVQGSVWDGEIAAVHYQNQALGRLRWQLSPWHLLLGEARVDWQLDGPYGRAEGKLDQALLGQESAMRDLDLDLAVSLVSDLGWSPLSLAGRLQGQLTLITLEGEGSMQVAGQLQWQNATLSAISLGKVSLRAGEHKPKDSIILNNEQGDITLAGKLMLFPAHEIDLFLTLQPVTTQGITAVKILSSIGTAMQDGGVQVQFRGPIPTR